MMRNFHGDSTAFFFCNGIYNIIFIHYFLQCADAVKAKHRTLSYLRSVRALDFFWHFAICFTSICMCKLADLFTSRSKKRHDLMVIARFDFDIPNQWKISDVGMSRRGA